MTSAASHNPDHVKVVDALNYATIFPSCRAVVHHGGSGTTAAGLRAESPHADPLAVWLDQPMWAAAIEPAESRRAVASFSATTQDSLVADLRSVLTPRYAIEPVRSPPT